MDRARLIVMLCCLCAVGARASDSFTLDATRDADGGHALLGGLGQQRETWDWRLDVAHSDSQGATAEAPFASDDIGFALGWRAGAWRLGLDTDYWQDTNRTHSFLYTLKLGWQGESLRLSFEPARGRVSTPLPDTASLDVVDRSFTRSALAASFDWQAADAWRVYGNLAHWNYDPTLDVTTDALTAELIRLTDLRQLVRLVRAGQTAQVDALLLASGSTRLRQVLATRGLAGLTRVLRYEQRRVDYALSLHDFALGLSDLHERLGIERKFGDAALSFEYERLDIPVDGLQAQSALVRYRMPMTPQLDVAFTLGASRTEGYASTGFLELTFQYFID